MTSFPAASPGPKRRRPQPYKRRPRPDPFLRAIPNARTLDGKALRARRAELVQHCGGNPTAVQLVLIDTIISLVWQGMQLDRLAANTTGRDAAVLAGRRDKTSCTLARCIDRLDIAPTPPPRPTLASIDWSLVRQPAEAPAP